MEYNSDYEVRLATLAKMGGDADREKYTSVYDIDLEILKKTGGGGGGGATAIEMTQAEYDAAKEAGTLQENAIYIITDAPAVDMDDYYTKDEIDANIGEELANKADRHNVTAFAGNTYYQTKSFPLWNEKGEITGSWDASSNGFSQINGSYHCIVHTSGGNFNIYAPENAGSNGQVLMSKGNGAPVWKDGVSTEVSGGIKITKISEAAYEALTTKDANTLYLLTEE